MAKEYSEEAIRQMWEKVKQPTLEEVIGMIQSLRDEVKDFQSSMLMRLIETNDEITSLSKRIEDLEGIKSAKDVVSLKTIPREKAKVQVKEYIDQHQGCRTSDIMYELGLDPDLVLSILRELKEEGKIHGEPNE